MLIQSVQDIYTPSARLPFILSSEIVDLFRLGSQDDERFLGSQARVDDTMVWTESAWTDWKT